MKKFKEYLDDEINEEFQAKLPVDELVDELLDFIPEADGAAHIGLLEILAKYNVQHKQSGH